MNDKSSYRDFRRITINGHTHFFGTDQKTWTYPESDNLEKWESDLYAFIIEWMQQSESIIVRTSGSTGPPKEIHVLKNQMVASAKATAKAFNLKDKNSALLCLPVDYIAGKMMVVRAIVLGLNLIPVKPDGNPCKNLKGAIDFAAMLPFQFINAYKSSLNKLNLIKTLILGGTKVNNEVASMVKKIWPAVYETYGMTETLTHVAIKKIGENSTFKALDNVHFDVDADKCLKIQAPRISHNEVQTNDIVELISSTEFRLLGRRDNVINSGGVKLFPEQLEQKLTQKIKGPYFICGVKNKEFGERPILIIESQTNSIQLEDLNHYFTKIEMPAEIKEVPEILYTKSGKIDRFKTKKKYNLF